MNILINVADQCHSTYGEIVL